MKLGRTRPWRSKPAIQAASLTSVLRPGTCLMCWALTTQTVNCPSSKLKSGFQDTPVDSMATWVQPRLANQSARASRSSLTVLQLRWSCSTCPAGVVRSTHAWTTRLWTSNPQQQGCTTWMGSLSAIVLPPDERRPSGVGVPQESRIRALPTGGHRRVCLRPRGSDCGTGTGHHCLPTSLHSDHHSYHTTLAPFHGRVWRRHGGAIEDCGRTAVPSGVRGCV